VPRPAGAMIFAIICLALFINIMIKLSSIFLENFFSILLFSGKKDMRMKKIFSSLFMLFLTSLLFAFNHPEIKWKSVTTSHFIIHYYDKTEPAVYATWKIAEDAYAGLSSLYEYDEREKISIALADYDDYSNGFASWTDGSIMIWVTDARFDLRGNSTWLRNVITHELAHIVTLEKKSRTQLLDWTLELDYESPSASVSLAEPFATTRFWPEWFAEGTAQLESGRRGNDCWDSRRDMLLLDAVASRRALTLDGMGYFNHDGIGSELVYNQGYSFVKYIESKIGTAAFVRLWNSGRNMTLFMNTFKALFFDQTGFSLDALYRQWMDSLATAARKRVPADPTPAATVWNKGSYNYLPKVSSDGKWRGWLTSDKDDFSRTDLIVAPSGGTGNAITIQWALGSWDFSPDSRCVYFLKQREPSDHGSFYNDLYVLDLTTKSERRLTRGARLYDIAVSPDNQKIACVQFRSGVYSIVQTDMNARSWETLVQGTLGEPFIGLSFSPVKTSIAKPAVKDTADSTRTNTISVKHDSAAPAAVQPAAPSPPEYMLATSKVISGRARICIVGTESRTMTVCGPASGQQEYPHWGRDGRIYFDADYDGVFNIYSMNPDGTGLQRHTTVFGGMFQPFLDNNGKLLCTQFAQQAFSVVSCPAAGAPYVPPDSQTCSFFPVPRPKGEVTIRSRPYEGKLLRPVLELQSYLSVKDDAGTFAEALSKNRLSSWSDTAGLEAGTSLVISRSDALGRKDLSLAISGLVIHPGIEITDSSWKDTARAGHSHALLAAPDFIGAVREALAQGRRPQHQFIGGRASTLLNDALFGNHVAAAAAARQQSSSTDSGSGPSVQWMPVLAPGISLQNSTQEISLEFDAQAILELMVPVYLSVAGEGLWQLARDWYVGASPQALVYTTEFGNSSVLLPFGLIWLTYNYENTDIAYNDGGVTRMQVSVEPDFFGVADTSSPGTVSWARRSSVTYALSFSHGFPIMKYASFILSTDDSYTKLSANDFIDTRRLLKGLSSEFLNLDAGASLVFPLWRQINAGPLYADALYAEIGYDFSVYANSLNLGGHLKQAFIDPLYYNDHLYPLHQISVGTKLGFFKSYTFSRTLSIKVLWDMMRNNAGFNFSVGF